MSQKITQKVKKNDEGQVLEECEYLGDLIHGKRIIWHPSNVKISETDFVLGEMDGQHTSWYLNGNVALQAAVAGGDYHGLFISFWPNGEKREEGMFEQGERAGAFKSWSDKGELLSGNNK